MLSGMVGGFTKHIALLPDEMVTIYIQNIINEMSSWLKEPEEQVVEQPSEPVEPEREDASVPDSTPAEPDSGSAESTVSTAATPADDW
jgi:hypothetical protein